MDTITHGLVGALIGKAFFADDAPPLGTSWLGPAHSEGRVAIVCATVGAVFPDIDVFEGLFNHDNLTFITTHRGVTHSLPMLMIWAAGLALLAGWLARSVGWRAPTFAQLFSIFGAVIASHIFLDLLTSWGTMVWSPIDHTRLAWDWLFVIDLTVTLAALVPQLSAWVHRPGCSIWLAPAVWLLLSGAAFVIVPFVQSVDVPLSSEAVTSTCIILAVFLLVPIRRRGQSRFGRVVWSRIGVVLLVGYISFAAGMHYIALGEVRQYATEGQIDYQDLAAIPLPPWPGRWAGLISTASDVYRIQFNLLGGEIPRLDVFRTAAPNRYVASARDLPGVQKFLWFARFPVFTYLERDGHPVVQISDIRFVGPRRPGVATTIDTPASNFTYEVVFATDGSVISSRLLTLN